MRSTTRCVATSRRSIRRWSRASRPARPWPSSTATAARAFTKPGTTPAAAVRTWARSKFANKNNEPQRHRGKDEIAVGMRFGCDLLPLLLPPSSSVCLPSVFSVSLWFVVLSFREKAPMMLRNLSAVILLLLTAAFTRAADYSIKTTETAPPTELGEDVRKLLDTKGVQLLDAKGDLLAELWFRKEVPSKATPEQVKNGLTYRELEQ